MNFGEDIRTIALKELSSFGFLYNDDCPMDLALRRLFNLRRKLIDSRPRTILLSRELKQRVLGLDKQSALDQIREKLQNGQDVNGHLSRKALDPEFADLLLLDWSIHHFHLSTSKKDPKDFFFERSEVLLFAVVGDETVYLLDVLPHGDKNVFARRALVGIVQSNWPEMIAPYEMKGVIKLEHDCTDEEIDELRRAGLNVPICVNGRFYIHSGGGVTTAGTSALDQMKINDVVRWVRKCTKEIEERRAEILTRLNKNRILPLRDMEPRVVLVDGQFAIIEDQTGTLL